MKFLLSYNEVKNSRNPAKRIEKSNLKILLINDLFNSIY